MLKLALEKDIDIVMQIINDAKKYLNKQNLSQWNLDDGYPRKEDLLKDIDNKSCYLYLEDDKVIGCMSILFTPDENYFEIEGNWLTTNSYASIHRIAVKNNQHHKGIGIKMLLEAENIVKNNKVYSIKIDTHNSNIPMTKTILNAGYTYCGVIKLKRSEIDNLRDAYEKRLAE
jgi:ribosomal protein S18 acetylase RimI-like enzyme